MDLRNTLHSDLAFICQVIASSFNKLLFVAIVTQQLSFDINGFFSHFITDGNQSLELDFRNELNHFVQTARGKSRLFS